MHVRTARRITIVFFVAYTLALTYPGIVPFNRVRPLVFGLPLPIFWVALWVALSGVVFGWLRRIEKAAEERAASGEE